MNAITAYSPAAASNQGRQREDRQQDGPESLLGDHRSDDLSHRPEPGHRDRSGRVAERIFDRRQKLRAGSGGAHEPVDRNEAVDRRQESCGNLLDGDEHRRDGWEGEAPSGLDGADHADDRARRVPQLRHRLVDPDLGADRASRLQQPPGERLVDQGDGLRAGRVGRVEQAPLAQGNLHRLEVPLGHVAPVDAGDGRLRSNRNGPVNGRSDERTARRSRRTSVGCTATAAAPACLRACVDGRDVMRRSSAKGLGDSRPLQSSVWLWNTLVAYSMIPDGNPALWQERVCPARIAEGFDGLRAPGVRRRGRHAAARGRPLPIAEETLFRELQQGRRATRGALPRAAVEPPN